jgi:hypothetical protein
VLTDAKEKIYVNIFFTRVKYIASKEAFLLSKR